MNRLLTIMSLVCTLSTNSFAITNQEAAQLAESSRVDAASAIQERNAAIMTVVNEISSLEVQISEKLNDVKHDTRVRNVSLGLTALGAVLIGGIASTSSAGDALLGKIISSLFVAVGMSVTGGNAAVYQYFVTIDAKKLEKLRSDLAVTKKSLSALVNENK